MTTISLHCLFLGDGLDKAFVVEIPQDEMVASLKDKIREMAPARFRDVNVAAIRLFKPQVSCSPDEVVNLNNIEELTSLKMSISNIFKAPLPKDVHVIALLPDDNTTLGNSDGGSWEVAARRRTMRQVSEAQRPSVVARSVAAMLEEQHKNPLYNGIPASLVGPPISIYEPSFATIHNRLENLSAVDVDDDLLREVSYLMLVASRRYDTKSEFQRATIEPLFSALGVGLDSFISPGGGLALSTHLGVGTLAAFAHVQWTLDFGSSGDGQLQGALGLRKHLLHSEYSKIVNSSCCPCILITIAGPYIAFAGFICTTVCISEPFTTYLPLVWQPERERAQVLELSRYFKVFKDGLAELQASYSRIVPQELVPATLLPKPMYRQDENLEHIVFEGRFLYDGLLEEDHSHCIFRAQYGDKPALVKFGERYGEEAHRLLADAGLAPKLYACVEVGGNLTMAVMEHVYAKDAASVFEDKPLPPDVMKKLNQALQILHEHNLVFGDLRRPNILVSKATSEGDGEWVTRLVDFTWAGIEGVNCYPPNLNMGHDWHCTVTRSGRMRREHDIYCLGKL